MLSQEINKSMQLYIDDEVDGACQLLFKKYGVSIEQTDPFAQIWINYLSSMCFEFFGLSTCPNLALQNKIEQDTHLLIEWDQLVPRLQLDERIMRFGQSCPKEVNEAHFTRVDFPENAWLDTFLNCEHHHIFLTDKEREALFNSLNFPFKKSCQTLFNYSQTLLKFFQTHFSFGDEINFWNHQIAYIDNYRPFWPYLFPYKGEDQIHAEIAKSSKDETLIFFMEAVDNFDYPTFYSLLEGRKAIFLFPNLNTFLRNFGAVGFSDSLMQENFRTLLLSSPLTKQWQVQGEYWEGEPKIKWISFTSDSIWEHHKKELSKSLLLWFKEHNSDKIYVQAKRLNTYQKSKHLGTKASLSYYRDLFFDTLYDYHMHPYNEELQKFPSPLTLDPKVLHPYLKQRKVRPYQPGEKTRVAHLMITLNDQWNHAPSMRLKTLLQAYTQEKYEVTVMSVEQGMLRLEEYPSTYYQQSSLVLAPILIENLREKEMDVYIDYHSISYEDSAKHIAEELALRKIDVALFHEVSPLNLLISSLCDVPYRVYFEHGSVPFLLPFEAVILSHKEEINYWKSKHPKWNGVWFGNDKAHSSPVTKKLEREDLSVDGPHLILMTVCSQLEKRMTPHFCECVGQILQQVPEAHFFSIGSGSLVAQESIFKRYHVMGRVRSLGFQHYPANYLALADLYLNEFPYGGSSSVCEALSQGCPVVSMYDSKSEWIATRSGSYFMGQKPYITTQEGYVKQAVKLLKDEKLRSKWRKEATCRSEFLMDTGRYQAQHLQIIEQLLKR